MKEQIIKWINDYVSTYAMKNGTETTWRHPVIGFANAHDSRFNDLKSIVGESHVSPNDLMEDAESVIVFFLPFSKEIIMSNIGESESSRQWDIANIETNRLIMSINEHINLKVSNIGYNSTIMPATYNYDEKLLKSDWSHRHVAHIAGIGTFGLNGVLITNSGCCGRIGSIITNVPLDFEKEWTSDKCLYKHNRSCGVCVNRCVANAISLDDIEGAVNRWKCNDQIYNDNIPVYDIGIGDACGKCMCGLPCSLGDPVSKLNLSE